MQATQKNDRLVLSPSRRGRDPATGRDDESGAIAEQLGVDRSTVYRLLGWRSMPEPTNILPAPPDEVYTLMRAQTTDRNTIRRRIDVFCRAIPDRAFAKHYRLELLATHRRNRIGLSLPDYRYQRIWLSDPGTKRT